MQDLYAARILFLLTFAVFQRHRKTTLKILTWRWQRNKVSFLFEVCIIIFMLPPNEHQDIAMLLKRQNIFVESLLILSEQFSLPPVIAFFRRFQKKVFSLLYHVLHQQHFERLKSSLFVHYWRLGYIYLSVPFTKDQIS